MSSYAHVVHTTAKQIISRRRKNENVFKMSKDEKCTCKACKNSFSLSNKQIYGFLLPSSSWLLKLPVKLWAQSLALYRIYGGQVELWTSLGKSTGHCFRLCWLIFYKNKKLNEIVSIASKAWKWVAVFQQSVLIVKHQRRSPITIRTWRNGPFLRQMTAANQRIFSVHIIRYQPIEAFTINCFWTTNSCILVASFCLKFVTYKGKINLHF